jgi:Holliday junction resolvase RusA-like endonuclease
MVKFILDAFEGPLYENDNAIVELTATKKFSTTNDAFVMVKVSMD